MAKQVSNKDAHIKINHWSDCFISPHKDIGMVSIEHKTKFNHWKRSQYSLSTKDYMLDHFKNSKDTYISLNGFKDDSNGGLLDKSYFTIRKQKNLKQIRNIMIDLDFYKKYEATDAVDMKNEVLFFLKKQQDNPDVSLPMPNLMTYSHGIQLFWTLGEGAAPSLFKYIQKINKAFLTVFDFPNNNFSPDLKCIDSARLVRLPETINTRNNSKVVPLILNDQSYTFDELYKAAKKIIHHNHKNDPKPKEPKDNPVFKHQKDNYFKCAQNVNYMRTQDIIKLMSQRQDKVGCRNEATYSYAYSFQMEAKYKNVDRLVKQLVWFDRKCQLGLEEAELKSIAKSVHEEVANYYQTLGKSKNLPYSSDDGIIRPKSTNRLIKELSITHKEQLGMRTLCSVEIRQEHKKQSLTTKRRKQGVKSRQLTNLLAKKDRLEMVKGINQIFPHKTQAWIANLTGASTGTISRDLSAIKKGQYKEIMALSVSELLMRLKDIVKKNQVKIFTTNNRQKWTSIDYEVALIMLRLNELFSLGDYLKYHSLARIIKANIGRDIGKLKRQLSINSIKHNEYRNNIQATINLYKEKFDECMSNLGLTNMVNYHDIGILK